jgi:hypothetical protein
MSSYVKQTKGLFAPNTENSTEKQTVYAGVYQWEGEDTMKM